MKAKPIVWSVQRDNGLMLGQKNVPIAPKGGLSQTIKLTRVITMRKRIVKSVPVDRTPMQRLRQGVRTVSLGKHWQMPQQARQHTMQKLIVSSAGLARLALKGRQRALIAMRALS